MSISIEIINKTKNVILTSVYIGHPILVHPFQNSLIPLINKPTRVNRTNTTAIGNILTNTFLTLQRWGFFEGRKAGGGYIDPPHAIFSFLVQIK